MSYAKIKELPVAIQQALASVGYGREDIRVETVTEVSLSVSSE